MASLAFCRLEAHALGHALASLAAATPMSTARAEQAGRLRAVAEALPASYFVGFVDEAAYLNTPPD